MATEQVFSGSLLRVPDQMGSGKLTQEPLKPGSLAAYPEGMMACPG